MPAKAEASAAVTSWQGSSGVAEGVWLGEAADEEAAAGDDAGATGGGLDEGAVDGGVVGVDDPEAGAEELGARTFGALVGTAACFVDLQLVTDKTEQSAMLSTTACRRIFVPSLVAVRGFKPERHAAHIGS